MPSLLLLATLHTSWLVGWLVVCLVSLLEIVLASLLCTRLTSHSFWCCFLRKYVWKAIGSCCLEFLHWVRATNCQWQWWLLKSLLFYYYYYVHIYWIILHTAPEMLQWNFTQIPFSHNSQRKYTRNYLNKYCLKKISKFFCYCFVVKFNLQNLFNCFHKRWLACYWRIGA